MYSVTSIITQGSINMFKKLSVLLSLIVIVFLVQSLEATTSETILDGNADKINDDVISKIIDEFSLEEKQCKICAVENSTLRNDFTPLQLSNSERPIFLSDEIMSTQGGINISTMTCGDWQAYVDEEIKANTEYCLTEDQYFCEDFCLAFENWLEYSCCDGIIPRYECSEIVRNIELVSHDNGIPYDKIVAPIHGDYTVGINVYVSIEMNSYEISNYGVDGGSVRTVLKVTESWIDTRLRWDPDLVGGCTQIHVQASLDPKESEIWVPGRGKEIKHEFTSSDATVLADGSVSWSRTIEVDTSCETIWDHVTKLCKFSFSSDEGGLMAENGIHYIVGNHYDVGGNYNEGILVEDISAIPGYTLNKDLTMLSSEIKEGTDSEEIILYMHFDPLVTDCYLCGGIAGTALRNDTVPPNNNDGGYLSLSSHIQSWSCQQIDDYLSTNYTVNDTKCDLGREYFTGTCCDGIPSRNVCEENIRSRIFEKKKDIIAPPDPPTTNGSSMIDVEVLLDFTHIIDIDIKLNILEVLVSLELIWHDERLKWDPFVGGCNVISMGSYLEVEVREMWIPEIDLLDQVEGANTLPDSLATVFQDGMVWWKRTGVLKVACDLTGLKWYPFDKPSCYMDFGAQRSPLAHRLNYTTLGVEFSKHLKERTGKYHEYHVDANATNTTIVTEELPSYVNRFIRYTFYFERASSYYMWTFIALYILFTYLSFGMFFLDQQVGERLGYGTGILFVVVAQDITVWAITPVTQEQLWINILSFGSKMAVIAGIIQSVYILYLYYVNDTTGDGHDDFGGQTRDSKKEMENLIKNTDSTIINKNNNKDSYRSDSEDSDSEEKYNLSPYELEANAHSDSFSITEKEEDGNGVYHSELGRLDVQPTNRICRKSAKNKNDEIGGYTTTTSTPEQPHPSSRRSSITRRSSTRLHNSEIWMLNQLLGYKRNDEEHDSAEREKILKLRLWDRITAIVFFSLYSIFLIVICFMARFKAHDH